MSQSEARSWWADVEHLRETIERRRAAERGGGDVAAPSAQPLRVRDGDDLGAHRAARRGAAGSGHAPGDRHRVDAGVRRRSAGDETRERGRHRRDDPARRAVPHRRDEARLESPARRGDAPGRLAPVAPREGARLGTRPAGRHDDLDRAAIPQSDRRAAMQALAPRRDAAPGDARARRRTVEITGRTVGAPDIRPLAPPPAAVRRRPAPLILQAGPRPDRIAMWAVILGFVLIVVAATSGQG